MCTLAASLRLILLLVAEFSAALGLFEVVGFRTFFARSTLQLAVALFYVL
jgi:hypothetical protein